MKILLAENAGFCWGVKRVVKLTEEKIGSTDKKIFTHGPLIHNQEVIRKLENKGVTPLQENLTDDQLKELPGGSVVFIRAHGIPPEGLNKLNLFNFEIIDGTCPHVVKIQKVVHAAYADNRTVLILGDKGHAEVVGLLGYCPDKGYVISKKDDLINIKIEGAVTVVAQSTLDLKTFDELTHIIKNKWKDVIVINTRCNATERRQSEAMEMCGHVDAMIVIGGRNSANTNRLAQICRKQGVKTFHIENTDEIKNINFNDVKIVGVTAGASTPDWIIESVVGKLGEM